MSRVELTDSTLRIMAKMAEGNPGAATVLVRLLKEGNAIDQQALIGNGGVAAILTLDSCEIYGSRIWLLYKDVCKEDLVKTMAVLRAFQCGITRIEEINIAIDNRGQGLDVEAILVAVKAELKGFDNPKYAEESHGAEDCNGETETETKD